MGHRASFPGRVDRMKQRPSLLRTEAHDNQNVGLWVFGESDVAAQSLTLGQPDMLSFGNWQAEVVSAFSNSRIGSFKYLEWNVIQGIRCFKIKLLEDLRR